MSLLADIGTDVAIKDPAALLATGQQQGTSAGSATASGRVGMSERNTSAGSFRSNWQAMLASLDSSPSAEQQTAGAQQALPTNEALGLASRIAASARTASAQSSLGTESLTSLIPGSSGQNAAQSNTPLSVASSADQASAQPEGVPVLLANAQVPLPASSETSKTAFTVGDTTKHASDTVRRLESKETVTTPSSDAANATALLSPVVLPIAAPVTQPVEARPEAGIPGTTQLGQPGNVANSTASTTAIAASAGRSTLPSMGVQAATSRSLPSAGQADDSSADPVQPATTSAPSSQLPESSPSETPIAVTPRTDSSPVQTGYPVFGDPQNQNPTQDSVPSSASRHSASAEDHVLYTSSGARPTSAEAAAANTAHQSVAPVASAYVPVQPHSAVNAKPNAITPSAAITESETVSPHLTTAADRTSATNSADAPPPLAQPSLDPAQPTATTGETTSTSVTAATTSEAPSTLPVRAAERTSVARLSSAASSRNSRKAENVSQEQSITPSFQPVVLDSARTPSTLSQVTTTPTPTAQATAESVSNSVSSSSTSPQDGAFAALDSATRSDSTQWTHTGTQRAEAGFHDPALGWVGVRAEGARGQVHATVLPGSSDAAQVLGGHMAGLHAYLDGAHTSVQSVRLASPEGRESTFGSASDQGAGQSANQSMHQGNGQNPSQNPAPYSARPSSPATLSSGIPSSPRNAPEVLAAPGQLAGPTTASGTRISVMA